MKKTLILAVVLLFFAFQGQAQILGEDLSSGPGSNIDAPKLIKIFGGLACWLIRVAIVAVSIALVFYGILFLKSRGSPQGIAYAKKALSWGIVGAIVIFGVFTIILSLAAVIGVDYPITSILSC